MKSYHKFTESTKDPSPQEDDYVICQYNDDIDTPDHIDISNSIGVIKRIQPDKNEEYSLLYNIY